MRKNGVKKYGQKNEMNAKIETIVFCASHLVFPSMLRYLYMYDFNQLDQGN